MAFLKINKNRLIRDKETNLTYVEGNIMEVTDKERIKFYTVDNDLATEVRHAKIIIPDKKVLNKPDKTEEEDKTKEDEAAGKGKGKRK